MADNTADLDIQPENLVEELFPPKPGGMVDRHRREKARRDARADEEKNESERIEQPSYRAVKTADQSPEVFAPQLITIAPGGVAPILPLSKYRYRATVIVSTAAASVVLCKDQGAAISGNGYPLPTGIPYQAFARAQLWGFNPGGSAIQVGVIAELYAPED